MRISGAQELQLGIVKETGFSDRAGSRRQQDPETAITMYRDMLHQSLAVTEDEGERRYLKLEIELLRLELEAIGAELTGDWARLDNLHRRIRHLEGRLDALYPL